MLSGVRVFRRLSQFVPDYTPPSNKEFQNFLNFLERYQDILVLTGAGVSTESGIPDYRSENVGVYARTSYKPIIYKDFVENADARRRYWARNFVGWPKFRSFRPNKNHFFISGLQAGNQRVKLITQNVDGLHSKAGSLHVLELHGNAYWVRCMNCHDTMSRNEFQYILEDKNPAMKASFESIRPDGDVEIAQEHADCFEVPPCEKCGGILKPTVVFFGQNIAKETVKEAEKLVNECDALLILGTTLSTFSSFRLVEQAYNLCKGLCLVNIGNTRADNMMDLKISTKISDLLSRLGESALKN